MNKIFSVFGSKKDNKVSESKKAIYLDFMEVEELNKKYRKVVKKYESKIKSELNNNGFGDSAKKFKIFYNDTCIHNDTLQLPIVSELIWEIIPNSKGMSVDDVTKYTIDIPYKSINTFKDTMLKEINAVDDRFSFKLVATSQTKDDIEATYISNQKVIER